MAAFVAVSIPGSGCRLDPIDDSFFEGFLCTIGQGIVGAAAASAGANLHEATLDSSTEGVSLVVPCAPGICPDELPWAAGATSHLRAVARDVSFDVVRVEPASAGAFVAEGAPREDDCEGFVVEGSLTLTSDASVVLESGGEEVGRIPIDVSDPVSVRLETAAAPTAQAPDAMPSWSPVGVSIAVDADDAQLVRVVAVDAVDGLLFAGDVSFSSDDGSVASLRTLSRFGVTSMSGTSLGAPVALLVGRGAGSATLTASLLGQSTSAPIAVGASDVTTIELRQDTNITSGGVITDGVIELSRGASLALRVVWLDAARNEQPWNDATFTTDTTESVRVAPAGGSVLLVTAADAGDTVVTATSSGLSANVTIRVR